MRFRKKPQEFDAEQYLPGQQRALPEGVNPGSPKAGDPRPYVVTAHGQPVYLDGGEWVVKEPDGNGYYPIKAEIMPTIADPVPTPEAP